MSVFVNDNNHSILYKSPSELRNYAHKLIDRLDDKEINNIFTGNSNSKFLSKGDKKPKSKSYDDYILTVNHTIKGDSGKKFYKYAKTFPNPYVDFKKNILSSRSLVNEVIDNDTKKKLNDLKNNNKSILLMKNAPFFENKNEVIKVPKYSNKVPEKNNYYSESFALGIGSLLDSVPEIKYDNELGYIKRNIFTQIIPLCGDASNEISPKKEVKLQTQSCYDLNNPDYTIFTTLKGHSGVKTMVLPVNMLIENLSPRIISILKRKEFRFFSKDKKEEITESVLKEVSKGNYEIRFNMNKNRIEGITDRAKKALESLKNVIDKDIKIPYINLESGDVLVLNNKSVLYGRSIFPDDKQRWLQRSYVVNKNNIFDFNMFAFKDARGRDCHEIIPRKRQYEDIQDFVNTSSEKDKLKLLNKIKLLISEAKGYRFIIEQDPNTKKLRMYLAVTDDSEINDSRWEKTGVYYNKRPVSITNNPLFEKALPDLETTKDSSETFIVFDNKKPGRSLIVPRQDKTFIDFNQFIEKSSDKEKLELFDVMARNAEKGNKIYVNGGISRHIPWLHIQLLKGEENKKKRL